VSTSSGGQYKIILVLFLIGTQGNLSADLIDIYKKGEIQLIVDSDFGKNADWKSIDISDFAIGPDGQIFISESRQNRIHIFDRGGKLIKTFGQRGQGPGDFVSPQDLSILDNKHLVVGEYALNRRISLFNLNGEFEKLFVTKYPVFDVIALKDNKIAILTQNSGPAENKRSYATNYSVIIKDILTDKDINIASFSQETKPSNITLDPFVGNVFISKIDDDKLVVGFSDIPEISIYSIDGKKINSFVVDLKRERVTNDMKEAYFRMLEDIAKGQPQMKQWIQKMRDEDVFPAYTPYYRRLAVDSEGNILVYKNFWIENIKNKKQDPFEIDEVKFQIYSKDGEFVGETKVNFGNIKPFFPTHFFGNFIYAWAREKEDEDGTLMRFSFR